MSSFRVTSAELTRGAEELLDLNSRFKNSINSLENQEGSLNGMWDGEANNAFHSAFITDKGKMEEFSQLIINYANSLKEIASRYERTEQMNTDIATRRTY